jgi:integrase
VGGKQPGAKREITCPRGVSVRTFKTEQRIQIAFSFRGVECRELEPPGAITQTAVTLAGGKRAEILRKISAGVFHYADYFPQSTRAKQFDTTGRRVLMGKLLDRQLEAYEHQVKNGSLSPSTLDGYRKAITSDRMKYWRDLALHDATPSKLRDWIGGLGLTSKFTRNLLTPLRSVFEDALNDELIKSNPFDKIALNKLIRQTSKASDYEVDPFNAEERAKLLEAARPDERPMLRFWLASGLRPGELIALRWDRVDVDGRKARIDLNQVGGVEKGPKTSAGIRDVELNDSAIEALEAQRPITFGAGERVFPNPRTGRAWTTDSQLRKTWWVPLLERSGVRYRNPYQCRHTYASALLTAGHNPWFVAQQLGHVDVQLVFTTYGKFIPEDYRKPGSLRLVT